MGFEVCTGLRKGPGTQGLKYAGGGSILAHGTGGATVRYGQRGARTALRAVWAVSGDPDRWERTWAWTACSSRPERSLAAASSSICSRSPAASASSARTREPKASLARVSSCSSSCGRGAATVRSGCAPRRSGRGGRGAAAPGRRAAEPRCCSAPCPAGWLWTPPRSAPRTRSPARPAERGAEASPAPRPVRTACRPPAANGGMRCGW